MSATAAAALAIITHTAAEGTLICGTARSDGSAELLRLQQVRWSRAPGCWYVPRSRDRQPDLVAIGRVADALRAAGFDVDVQVDATRRSTAEVEADRAARGRRSRRTAAG